MTNPTPPSHKEDWREEFRDYFDKRLKPKKPTMKNLDRELLVDFIEKTIQTTRAKTLEEAQEKAGSLNYYWQREHQDKTLIRLDDVISLISSLKTTHNNLNKK